MSLATIKRQSFRDTFNDRHSNNKQKERDRWLDRKEIESIKQMDD